MKLEKIIADKLFDSSSESMINEIQFIENKQLSPLLDNLKEFILTTDDDNFLVLLVEENEVESENEIVDLKYLAGLSGFYNARYLYELVTYEKIRLPIGVHHKYFKSITYKNNYYTIMSIKLPMINKNLRINKNNKIDSLHHFLLNRELELNLDQVFDVADKLTNFHVASLPNNRKREAREIIEENYQLIEEYTSEKLQLKVNDYLEIVLEKNGQFFRNTDNTFQKFNTLFKTFKKLEEIYPESNLPIIMCHGNLSSNNLKFDNRNELQFIDNWENVHFGSAAEDLSYLMITSLSPEVRRNNFMKIFRRYYYTLVDKYAIKFKLQNLKEFYFKFIKLTVFLFFPTLAAILNSDTYSDEEKYRAVTRWDSAVDDAYDIETDNYISDNEDNLTKQNSENRSVAEVVMKTRYSTESSLP